MGVNIFITCVAVLLLVLEIIYWTRFRSHQKEVFNPIVSWTRAWIVFLYLFHYFLGYRNNEQSFGSPPGYTGAASKP